MEALFPKWPFVFSEMALFGIILLFGLIGSQLVRRTGFVPRITGYLAIGFLLGPSNLNWLNNEVLGAVQIFVDIGIGLVLFELGRRLDLEWLRHNLGLLATSIGECLFSFGAILAVLLYVDFPPLQAAFAAAIGIATAPGVVLLVARDLAADGQVTRRAINLVAINNVIALIAFTVLLSLGHLNSQASWATILLHPVYLLLGSLTLGMASFFVMLVLARFLGKNEAQHFILLVGSILLAVGAARMLNLSVLMTLLALGIFAKNFDWRHAIMDVEFGYAGELFFVLLFVVAGAGIRFNNFPDVLWIALAFVVVRSVAKLLPAIVFARMSGASVLQGAMLGVLLLPLAAIAFDMTQSVMALYPGFGDEFRALMVTSISLLEVVGPVAAQYALKRVGEAQPSS